jgi:hypothetical protein
LKEKKLADSCYTCKSEEVFEGDYTFKGEQLTLSICPICRVLNDWELPKGLLDKDNEIMDEDLNDEVAEWARNEAKVTLINKDLWYRITFSRKAEASLVWINKEELNYKAKELAELLGMRNVAIGIHGNRVSVQIW